MPNLDALVGFSFVAWFLDERAVVCKLGDAVASSAHSDPSDGVDGVKVWVVADVAGVVVDES